MAVINRLPLGYRSPWIWYQRALNGPVRLEAMFRVSSTRAMWLPCRVSWIKAKLAGVDLPQYTDILTWYDRQEKADDLDRPLDRFRFDISSEFRAAIGIVAGEIGVSRKSHSMRVRWNQCTLQPVENLQNEDTENWLNFFHFSNSQSNVVCASPFVCSIFLKYISRKWRSWFGSKVRYCSSIMSYFNSIWVMSLLSLILAIWKYKTLMYSL